MNISDAKAEAALNVAPRRLSNRRFFFASARSTLARIGRYYATESMLVLDPETGEYSSAATPSYGRETLRSFYKRVLEAGLDGQELGDHSLFERTARANES